MLLLVGSDLSTADIVDLFIMGLLAALCRVQLLGDLLHQTLESIEPLCDSSHFTSQLSQFCIRLDWQTAASNTGHCSLTTAAVCRGRARAQTDDPRAVTAARDPSTSTARSVCTSTARAVCVLCMARRPLLPSGGYYHNWWLSLWPQWVSVSARRRAASRPNGAQSAL